jgi:hypothetical protein
MRYLNLNDSEIKELLYIRRERLVIYVLTLLVITAGSYLLLQWFLRIYLSIFIVVFLALVYTTYTFYKNRKYLKEVFLKQKKVYRGVLSFKIVSRKNRKRKYLFNVDGNIFYVDRKDFDCIQEGDIVEFHVSSSTKYLFRVEKVEE